MNDDYIKICIMLVIIMWLRNILKPKIYFERPDPETDCPDIRPIKENSR